MKSKRIGSFLLVFLFLSRLVLAADVSVELSVDKPQVGQDEEVSLDVTVRGLQGADQPEIQGLDHFDVRSTGSSTQFQMVNGATSLQTVFSYLLMPKATGTFQIGPAVVHSGKATYTGPPVSVTVIKGAAPSQAASGDGGGGKADAGRRLFRVVQQVDNKSPYVNGQTLFTTKIYIRGPMQNAQLSLPEFKGFWKEQLGKQRETREVVNGVAWQVTELRFALFPVAPGRVEIPPTVLRGDAVVESDEPRRRRRGGPGGLFDEFFDDPMFGFGERELKPVRISSEPIALDVRPFPQPKPPGFAGLVGKFHLEASLGKSSVAVGDSTTLSLRLSGEGNLRDATLPTIDWKGFKVYEDKPSLESLFSEGKLGGSKTFKIALVPLSPGKIAIPRVAFTYLDPTSGKYAALETPPLTLDVAPGSGPEALNHVASGGTGPARKEVQTLGEDVMPIKRQLPSSSGDSDAERVTLSFFIFGLPLLYLLGLGYVRRRERRLSDAGLVRREKAFRNFQAGLKDLPAGSGFYEGASRVFRTYLGDKLGFDGKALTPADAERKLRPLGLSDATVKGVEEILKRLERGQYGGGASDDEARRLRVEIATLGERLQTEVRK